MNFDLLVDFHKPNPRQGPGSNAATRRALDLTGLTTSNDTLAVADLGCGTGASTLVLADALNAKITALDLFDDFLAVLADRAATAGVSDKIECLAGSMDDLPFAPQSLDLIWSEGAIYNIGFAKGIDLWRPLLKTGGVLAVSEITWLGHERPQELTDYWTSQYPEIAKASEKIALLEQQGFQMLGYFPLDIACWMDEYYSPMQANFDAFLNKHSSQDAHDIVAAERSEIDLYTRNSAHFSYGFYIAQRVD